MINPLVGKLALHLLRSEVGQRHPVNVHTFQVLTGRIEGRVRVKGINTHQPRAFTLLQHEGNGLIGTPCSLMIPRLNTSPKGYL